ncbi:Dyp-type peroxidase [Embleya sp. NPDC001921]
MTTTPVRPKIAPEIEQLPLPPLRTSTEIQGNILAAFNKDFMAFRYLRFLAREQDGGKGARGWLSAILNTIAVTAEVEDFNEVFSLSRRAYGHDPENLTATWVGVSLTYEGLRAVAKDPDQIEADLAGFEAFRDGAARRASALNDVDESAPDNWLFGSDRTPVHAVLLVAADTEQALNRKLENLEAAEQAHDVALVHQDDGRTLPHPLTGHEHFGYRDGISQPGVEGFHRADRDNPAFRENRAGSVLVKAGEFVFGQETEEPRPPVPKWMNDGSLQVVRRLRQDVPGWNKAVAEQAAAFEPAGFSADRLGACLVGRKKDGTPLADGTHPVTGVGSSNNDFDYRDDPEGAKTPWAAHIRRTHPRHFTDQGHRIMRRGIPFGPVAERSGDAERGLMFVCYNTSLEQQFEFVQKIWSNNPGFEPGEGTDAANGIDKLIGRADEGARQDADIRLGDGSRGTVGMKRFVDTTGALYAFTPSVTTLRLLASNKTLPAR